jgi:hypothetical protein
VRIARVEDRPVLLVDDLRPSVTQPWPDTVDAQPGTYVGPAFLGPLE